MGQNQKFMKKLKIDFLRMSLILYLVSIQLYYGWVLDFREISKGLWYLSSSWRFWNISSDNYFWLLGRNYLIYLANLSRFESRFDSSRFTSNWSPKFFLGPQILNFFLKVWNSMTFARPKLHQLVCGIIKNTRDFISQSNKTT